MGDTIPFFENEIKDAMQGIIKVVGVGGGGCNAVRRGGGCDLCRL